LSAIVGLVLFLKARKRQNQCLGVGYLCLKDTSAYEDELKPWAKYNDCSVKSFIRKREDVLADFPAAASQVNNLHFRSDSVAMSAGSPFVNDA
jgi:hypothetical protein